MSDNDSTSDEDATWLANRATEFEQTTTRMTANELRSLSHSLMDRWPRDGRSPEVFARALALSRDAVRRTAGRLPGLGVIAAVAAAAGGRVPAVPARADRQAALAMALHWLSLAGKGVHFVSWDDARARDAWKLFTPVGSLLGCDTALLTPAITGAARATAYSAAVTFGSYSELAADYLRDHLHDSRDNVAQRGLYAAVLDEVNSALAPLALGHVVITALAVPAEPPQVRELSASIRRGSDYRVDRKRQAVVFEPSGMARLKAAVGWPGAPLSHAIATAESVEQAIMRREGLGRRDGRELLADISVQGYLAAYTAVTGFSSGGRPAASLEDILSGTPYPSELAFERVIDRQRWTVYRFRASIRDARDPLGLIPPIANALARAWLSSGADALAAGLRDALAGWQTPEQIDAVLDAAAEQDELADRGARLVQEAVGRRADVLGVAEMATLLRTVLFTVVDLHWRQHLRRLRFLQRQSGALYGPVGPRANYAAREADMAALFLECEQTMRMEAIKYALNARH